MSTASSYIARDWLARSRGWLGILFLISFACVALFSYPALKEGTWGDFGVETLAWIVFVIGALFRWWATLYIGGRKGQVLACEGPYSVCRNPLYFGTFCLGLSVAIYLTSLVFAVGFVVASLFYLMVTVSSEERQLELALGSEYTEYCRTVPRFLPRFDRLRTPPTIEVSVRGLLAESVRAARWIWIPVLCDLVNYLRAESWWPHTFMLR